MKYVKDVFTEMLVRAQSRGSAATGIAMVTHAPKAEKSSAWVLRSPLPSSEFVKTDEYKKILAKVDTNCLTLIGHTRAVAGNNAVAEDNRNNHPHVHGRIIGIHNGRVTNDMELWKKYKGLLSTRKGICDSEVIVALVNHFLETKAADTTEKAIGYALSECDGWYAMAFLDTKNPNRLYIVKDSSTPLSLGWWKTPEVAMFGSNWDYLESAYDKFGKMHKNSQSTMQRCAMSPNQVVILDSNVRGNAWQDLFIGKHTFKTSKNTEEIISAHAEEFQTTQGK
jgi:glucosamine 6-phosphate synthetase-like amidotransferase/phosphosugar isomerase protein